MCWGRMRQTKYASFNDFKCGEPVNRSLADRAPPGEYKLTPGNFRILKIFYSYIDTCFVCIFFVYVILICMVSSEKKKLN